MLKSIFRKGPTPAPRPRVPDGVRVYAIGDIHGCDDQFAALLRAIDIDHAGRAPKRKVLILLGDLVDRGPDSAGVVERTRQLVATNNSVRLLAGNHEEMLLRSCAGDMQSLKMFARHGGRETALSYGIDPDRYDAAGFDELAVMLVDAIPAEHRELLAAAEELIIIGDYAFVHAGIRPGVALANQRAEDLRWIRDRFLYHIEPFERFIIHGHTITEGVDEQSNRIGIDTGAYLGGQLTAIALEDDQRWFLTS